MIEVINNYHVDYWFRNKVIDCGQISEAVHLKLEETVEVSDEAVNFEELESYLNSYDEFKQEETKETKINDNSIEDEEDYNIGIDKLPTIKVSQSIKQSKSSKQNKSTKPIYNFKREKKELPKTSRIDEFSLRKRNVLLDKFSRPKLN